MKNIRTMVLIILTFLISNINVYAECSVTDETKLTKEARNVKASFEETRKIISDDPNFNYPDGFPIEEKENYPVYGTYFKIHITNLTENLYVEVKNNIDNETKRYNYSDTTNGEIVIDQDDIDQIYKYTVTVYATNTDCVGKKLATVYTTTPMFNYLTTGDICDGAEDYYACQKWLTTPLTNMDTIEERINRYKETKQEEKEEEKKQEEEKGFQAFIKKNKGIIIIVSLCIIGVGGVVTVAIIKKQRSKAI